MSPPAGSPPWPSKRAATCGSAWRTTTPRPAWPATTNSWPRSPPCAGPPAARRHQWRKRRRSCSAEPGQSATGCAATPYRGLSATGWPSCRFRGSWSAWESGRVAAEGEHCEGDEGVGAFEAVGDAGEESDLGVGRFDQPLGESVVEGSVDGPAVADDAALKFDEGGDPAAASPGDPAVQGVFAGLSFDSEDVSQAFFEEVGPPQAGVGLGDPGELFVLAGREVLRPFPQGVAGSAERVGLLGPGDPAAAGHGSWTTSGVVPGLAADDLEGVAGPPHDMERIGAQDGLGAAGGDGPFHPVGSVRRDVGDEGAPVGAELRSEEHTSELQSLAYLVCRLLLEKKNK